MPNDITVAWRALTRPCGSPTSRPPAAPWTHDSRRNWRTPVHGGTLGVISPKARFVADVTGSRLSDALRDRYLIERELGRGGMATVYLAQDLKHHRPVALKVLRPELTASLGADRFVREIEIAASFDHPHILPLFDSGEADGFLYYVMPYVEGESLREPAHPGRSAPDRTRRSRSPARSPTRWPMLTARRGPSRHQAGEHPPDRRPGAWSRTSASRGRSARPRTSAPRRPAWCWERRCT